MDVLQADLLDHAKASNKSHDAEKMFVTQERILQEMNGKYLLRYTY